MTIEQTPQTGGSYRRDPDTGALERIQPAAPAAPITPAQQQAPVEPAEQE